MKKDITTIPISEVFEPKTGCPICRMRNMLEERMIEYTLGPSMMEPDVRIETNRSGFCSYHFTELFKQRNKLGLALIIESHLNHIEKNQLKTDTDACFICDNVSKSMDKMIDNLYVLYNKENQFRQLFTQQQYLCLPHYHLLIKKAKSKLTKKNYKTFLSDSQLLSINHLKELAGDVHHFCSMFDYRNNSEEADWGNSRDAVERAINYLTSRKVD